MTPEQQREQWLKRILPALAVLVLYFVFIGSWVGDKSEKAEKDTIGMMQKGVNAAALPGMEQEQSRIRSEIAKLDEEDKAIHKKLSESDSFLAVSGSANAVIDRVTMILAENHLQLLEEIPSEKMQDKSLSKSLRDTSHWLKELLPPDEADKNKPAASAVNEAALNIRKIRFIGAYPDAYRALSGLANSHVKALPVSLTMQPYGENTGKQEWILTLWL